MIYLKQMNSVQLTFWQARVLLLMTLEPRSVEGVMRQIARRGAVLNPARVRQLLNELLDLGLLNHLPHTGPPGNRYWLGSDPFVEQALDVAYAVMEGDSRR